MKEQPRILFVLRNTWADNLSLGNTLSNVFSEWDEEMATIYCRNEKINNAICKSYFRITERDLIRNIFNKDMIGTEIYYDTAKEESGDDDYNKVISGDFKFYQMVNRHRYQILLWGRELLWNIGGWKNNKLRKYIKSFNPDIIFLPLYDSVYIYKIAFYVQKLTKAKIVTYIGDDMYGFGKGHISPLYYIDMLIRRNYIRKAVSQASLCLCLTDEQQQAYQKEFNKKFIIMRKCVDCSIPPKRKKHTFPLNVVFTGNVNLGREDTIILIGKVLDRINKNGKIAEINIYTANSIKDSTNKYLAVSNSVMLRGSVSASEISRIQEEADIVLHVESFKTQYKERVRYSLSTKIVDYISKGKCILAVGPSGISSIEYIRRNDAGFIIDNYENIEKGLRLLLSSEQLIEEYEEKSWRLANKNHEMCKVQRKLYNEICAIV